MAFLELFKTWFRLTDVALAREFNGVAVSGLTPLIASALTLFAGGGGFVIAYLASAPIATRSTHFHCEGHQK